MSCALPDSMSTRRTARPVPPDRAMREEWWAGPAQRELPGSPVLPVQLVLPELQRRPAQH